MTFTNKAANEMRERIAGLDRGGPGARRHHRHLPRASARGSCAGRETAVGLSRSFTIYDRADQIALIKQVMRDSSTSTRSASRRRHAGLDRPAQERAGRRRHGQAPGGATSTTRPPHGSTRPTRPSLARTIAVDFDDLLNRAVDLFEQHADVLAKYQNRWQQILVDEYQDTNRAQYLICRHLAAKHKNLAVVGDDDQSIYSWRGADLRNILDFERDYPDAHVVKLEQNYRSTQTILDAAHAVCQPQRRAQGQEALDRSWSGHLDHRLRRLQRVRGGRVRRAPGRARSRAGAAAGSMARLLTRRADDDEGGLRYGDIAVGYRINAQSRVLEEAFMRFGIPYQLVGGTRFYERREVKDALAYVRLARNSADRVALERIVNVPARGIGEKTMQELRAWAESHGRTLWGAIERRARTRTCAAGAHLAGRLRRHSCGRLWRSPQRSRQRALFDAALERTGLED